MVTPLSFRHVQPSGTPLTDTFTRMGYPTLQTFHCQGRRGASLSRTPDSKGFTPVTTTPEPAFFCAPADYLLIFYLNRQNWSPLGPFQEPPAENKEVQ